MSIVTINTRVLHGPLTGVQRYILELIKHIGVELRAVAPSQPLHGVKGHMWEQFVLPVKVGRGLLWSPSNTGPLVTSRQVVTIHDTAVFDHPESVNPSFARWYRWLLPRLAQRVEHIITISEFTKGRIVETCRVAPEKITVIPNGVDPRFSPRPKDEITETRRALGIPDGRYVLTLGTLQPRKNLHRLLQAWWHIHDKVSDDVWLVVAGGSPTSLVFTEVILDKLPPRVHFTGHVADRHLPALYSGALAFAFVSIYEGFGLPLLEAMAANVPVLAGNRSAVPEVVGDAGLLVDPLDVESIADGLFRLIEDASLRKSLQAKGLARVKEYTWEKSARMTAEILQRYS